MAFYELKPQYECKDTQSAEWYPCQNDVFCEQDSIEWRVDYMNQTSLHNWVEEYDLHCTTSSFEIGLFGSLFFAAFVIGSLIFPPLSDCIGRRPIALIGILVQAICSTMLMFSSSEVFTYVLLFDMGLVYPCNIFVGYVLVMELIPESNTAAATSLTLGLDGLVLMWCSLFFMFVSNNWRHLYWMPVVGTYIAFIMVFCLPESPKHLVNRGKYDRARQVITKIAKENKLKRFNTREDEPYPNKDDLLVYSNLFKEEVKDKIALENKE